MTIMNKKKAIYGGIPCNCGEIFTPLSSRQKHCSPECRFKEIADQFTKSNECWVWPKGLFAKTRYGQFAIDKNTPEYAHRMSHRVFNGPTPDGFYVCHKCDNPVCFNPDHLFLGTPQDNVDDMFAKGRNQDYKVSGLKKLGNKREYISRIFTEDALSNIRKLIEAGLNSNKIATLFNVDYKTIANIKVRLSITSNEKSNTEDTNDTTNTLP